ncbi:MAG: peptidylprolyl isomerase [bacterium]
MKNLIPLMMLVLILSGCTEQSSTQTDTYGGNQEIKTNEAVQKENATATQDATSKLETAQVKNDSAMSDQKNNDKPIIKKTLMPDQNTFEDLVGVYSGANLVTNLGTISVKFYGKDSPKTVNNFLNLAKLGFYDGTRFHRIIKDFMIQGGDPNSKSDDWSTHGMGGPNYRFADEFNSHKLVRGSLAMANSGPNTNGSQFFIVTAAETPWLDGRHTNFGEVTAGEEVMNKIENAKKNENDHPLEDITIEKIDLLK